MVNSGLHSSVLAGARCRGAALGLVLLAVSAPAFGAAPASFPKKVSGPEISMLVRATIVALYQANLTGNYSVLHDLGDSRFQVTYTQAALADMFRGFRERQVNLEPAILYDAELDTPPRLTTDGLLRVVGHFPTRPKQVIFDFTFRSQGGIWRLDAINAGTRAPPLAQTSEPGIQSGGSTPHRAAGRG